MTLLLSSIDGLMGLKEGQSAWQLLYEGFFLESRFWAGNPLYEVFLNPDNMGSSEF